MSDNEAISVGTTASSRIYCSNSRHHYLSIPNLNSVFMEVKTAASCEIGIVVEKENVPDLTMSTTIKKDTSAVGPQPVQIAILVVTSQDATRIALPQVEEQSQDWNPTIEENIQEPNEAPICEITNTMLEQLELALPYNNRLSTNIIDDHVEAIVEQDDFGTLSANDTLYNYSEGRPSELEALQHFSSILAKKKINVERFEFEPSLGWSSMELEYYLKMLPHCEFALV
ncbi:hypothetical protein ACH5RR_006624 [Cinchona calisaya]|uniref:Uncharacterized protein n=1 Tax=Cinchona calisaya TaxID=153742 RepID=A0ABD3APU9_9GENT